MIERRQRRKAALIGVVVGVTLFVLTLGVFSVGETSRTVAERASAAHAYDEILLTTTISRAQLDFTNIVVDLGATAGVDVMGPVAGNVVDVTSALDAMEALRAVADAEFGGLTPETIDSIAAFDAAARAASSELVAGRSVDLGDVEAAAAELRTTATKARAQALQQLTSANTDLDRLGIIVMGFVAFVAPAVALLVYRNLTRADRSVLELEALVVRSSARTLARQHLTNRWLLATADAGNDAAEAIEQFTDALSALDGGGDVSTVASVDSMVRLVRSAAHSAGCTLEFDTHVDAAILVDPSLFAHGARHLFQTMADRGATRIHCDFRTPRGAVEMHLGDNGSKRSETETIRLLSPLDPTSPLAAHSPDVGLRVSNALITAAGGRLRAARNDASHVVAIRFGVAATRPAPEAPAAPAITAGSSAP